LKVTTDHRLIPENLKGTPKERDFTIIKSPHVRANGEAKNFMKLLNKTEQIAHLKGRNGSTAIQEMLTGYRSTPQHPATGVAPYEALMNRQVRTKLDHQMRERVVRMLVTRPLTRGARDTKKRANRMLRTGTPRNTTSL